MFQREIKQRSDILRKLIDECLSKYAAGFYFSTRQEVLELDYFSDYTEMDDYKFSSPSPTYALVVYDKKANKLKCRAGGITLKMLSEMVLSRYMKDEAPYIGDIWAGDEIQQLDTMKEYVKNILKSHSRVRSVERHQYYAGYIAEKQLARKKEEDTRDLSFIGHVNCFGIEQDVPYSSLYSFDDEDFSASFSEKAQKCAVINCYMLDVPLSLENHKKIPIASWHPSLYPKIVLTRVSSIAPKEDENWFYLSTPICVKDGFYFSPAAQTVDNAILSAQERHYFIAWHLANEEVDHIQLIPAGEPICAKTIPLQKDAAPKKNTCFDDSPEMAEPLQAIPQKMSPHRQERAQTPFSDDSSFPQTISVEDAFPQWRADAVPQISALPPDWAQTKALYAENITLAQMELLKSDIRLLCPKQREHGIAIANQKIEYDCSLQTLSFKHEETHAHPQKVTSPIHGGVIIMDGEQAKGICFPNLVRKNFSVAVHKTDNKVVYAAIYI